MPEVAEAFTIADTLNKALSERPEIMNIEYFKELKIAGQDSWRIEGSKTVAVFSRGKKVVFNQLENGSGREFYMIFFLGMSGLLLEKKQDYSRMIITYSNGKKVHFDDQRNFGSVNVVDDYQEFLKPLIGPDLLQDNVTVEQWLEVMASVGQNMSLVGFLKTEQRYFAGIGNYLFSEIMYDAKLMGNQKIKTLSDEQRMHLFVSTKKIVNLAKENRGLSIKDYVDYHGVRGTFAPKVYGVRGKNSDGYEVKTMTLGSQNFWYSPEVQDPDGEYKAENEKRKRKKKETKTDDVEDLQEEVKEKLSVKTKPSMKEPNVRKRTTKKTQ